MIHPEFPILKVRSDFPALNEKVYNKPLVYFDNAASTHKPVRVLDAIQDFYSRHYSNIHRGVHLLSNEATAMYEEARKTVAGFIHAASEREIIFTSGATASINLVASSFCAEFLHEGDEILLSEMEHHSNIVPWQLAAQRAGARLVVIPFDDSGTLMLEKLDSLISDRTKILAITHVSNTLGTINPVQEFIRKAHRHSVPVLVDGAQSVQHLAVNVQELDADFFVFSGHKIYGPTGIGVLYGKEKWLEQMPPWQGGGDMIETVSFKKTTFNKLPFKFEAGTSHFVGAHGLAEAIKYVQSVGLDEIERYENSLLTYATQQLQLIQGLRIIGTAKDKSGVISFLPADIHAFDAGMILDKMGIAVRTGTHCTQPIMDHFGIPGTIRASFSFYNTREEIDKLAQGITKIVQMFA